MTSVSLLIKILQARLFIWHSKHPSNKMLVSAVLLFLCLVTAATTVGFGQPSGKYESALAKNDFKDVTVSSGVEQVLESKSASFNSLSEEKTENSQDASSVRKHRARSEDLNGWKTGKQRDGAKRLKAMNFRRKLKQRESSVLSSCPTQTSYVIKRTAEDIFGEMVDVYPVINIGNLALDQQFYESFCDEERCSCAGVNKRRYKSSCQTTFGYSYARVVKSGEIGWSYIKVRSGCSCVIQRKRNAHRLH